MEMPAIGRQSTEYRMQCMHDRARIAEHLKDTEYPPCDAKAGSGSPLFVGLITVKKKSKDGGRMAGSR